MEVFWLLKPKDRARLMQWQYAKYGLKLEMASHSPPWEHIQAVPEIPVHTDMDEIELQKFISQPASHTEQVK